MSSRVRIRYVVHCQRHGSESTAWAGKQVVVSQFKNKKDQFESGCPYCKEEERKAQAEAVPAA